jgi:hypothetical protein
MSEPPPTAGKPTEEHLDENGGEAEAPSSSTSAITEPLKVNEGQEKRWLNRLLDRARDATADKKKEEKEQKKEESRLDTLRALSAEAHDLRIVLGNIRRGEATLERYADYIKETCAQMDRLVHRIRNEGDDCIRRVCNAWEQMKICSLAKVPHTGQIKAEELIQDLNLLDVQCRRIMYWTGYKTVPNRLQRWLDATKPGYAIPFHAVFENELPDAEDRQKVLQFLAWTPTTTPGGIIDLDSGLVYRYDQRLLRQVVSLVLVVVMLALATSLVYIAGKLPPLNQFTLAWTTLFMGWVGVLIGTVVHIGVGTAKQMRAQGENSAVLPVSKFWIILNAKEGFILLRIFMALIGFFTLVFTSGMTGNFEIGPFLLNALLVGYSLDSVVELFGTSMDQRVDAQHANLKKQLGVE